MLILLCSETRSEQTKNFTKTVQALGFAGLKSRVNEAWVTGQC